MYNKLYCCILHITIITQHSCLHCQILHIDVCNISASLPCDDAATNQGHWQWWRSFVPPNSKLKPLPVRSWTIKGKSILTGQIDNRSAPCSDNVGLHSVSDLHWPLLALHPVQYHLARENADGKAKRLSICQYCNYWWCCIDCSPQAAPLGTAISGRAQFSRGSEE